MAAAEGRFGLSALILKSMHRSWKILTVVGLVLAVTGFGFFVFERNDELAFLSKFDPVDQRCEMIMMGSMEIEKDGSMHPAETGAWCRMLRFPKKTPELIAALRKYCPDGYIGDDIDVVLPSGRQGHFYASDLKLVFYDEPQPSWLDTKMEVLKQALHMRPDLVYARDQ